jgi:hypothetical protein
VPFIGAALLGRVWNDGGTREDIASSAGSSQPPSASTLSPMAWKLGKVSVQIELNVCTSPPPAADAAWGTKSRPGITQCPATRDRGLARIFISTLSPPRQIPTSERDNCPKVSQPATALQPNSINMTRGYFSFLTCLERSSRLVAAILGLRHGIIHKK